MTQAGNDSQQVQPMLDMLDARQDQLEQLHQRKAACPKQLIAVNRFPAPVYLTSLVPILNEQVRRDWRHLVFLQFEAWLHADMPASA